jgi:MYXO-CTERM domain-containing protein
MRIRCLFAILAAAVVLLSAGTAHAQTYKFATGVEYEVLSTDTKDPLFIQVAPDGRVFWVEREGRIEVLKPDGTQANVGKLPVSANACDEAWCPEEVASLEEGGLYSILLDRDFATTGKVYLYRSVANSFRPGEQDAVANNAYDKVKVCKAPACDVAKNFGVWRLSSFTIDADSKLVPGSEKVIFEVPAEWLHCCHYGGNLEWLPDGTILLSTGDDIAATAAAYGQTTNPLEGDAEKSSQNPADRRGKILRLMPDGSVPDGSVPGIKANPFLVTDESGVAVRDANGEPVTKKAFDDRIDAATWGGDPKDRLIPFDPYVYTMGYKQPFRGAVLPNGGAIFGEVGPDAYVDLPGRGPLGVEELNEIPPGGGTNDGWPRCSGANKPYYPYEPVEGAPSLPFVGNLSTATEPFDCSKMNPATLYYPHHVSEKWPAMGAGGVTSSPATFYRADTKGPLRLPHDFDNKLILGEESRSGVIAMPVTADGHLVTDESQWLFVKAPSGSPAAAFAPAPNTPAPQRPIDATVGPDGAIYFVEYSNGFYNGASSKISRLKCAGCTDAMSQGLKVAGARSGETNEAGLAPPVPVIAIGALIALAAFAARRRRSLV